MPDANNLFKKIREERTDLANTLKKYKGFKSRLVDDLYPDDAHFIYELLQNAEDKRATKAEFILQEDCLIFKHNGEPFNEADIWGITNFGDGTKADDEEKIGRFGIGFKAVFSYTNTPYVWSPKFSFKIEDLVLPFEIETLPNTEDETLFKFPFNGKNKSSILAYSEIECCLNELDESTLIFLTNLISIKFQNGNKHQEVTRTQHNESHIEITRNTSGGTIASTHYLRFSELVDGLSEQYVRIAFELQCRSGSKDDKKETFASRMAIKPALKGIVAISFPAHKEISGLRFHLHAPFIPELSRASVKNTTANNPLYEQLANLAASSMHKIRDLELLTPEFLGVIPNPTDEIGEYYKIIREKIIDEFNTQSLTPTNNNEFSPAQYLLQGPSSLKALLTRNDIILLSQYSTYRSHYEIGRERVEWTIDLSTNNNHQNSFLSGLDIKKWDIDDFALLLWEVTDPDYDDLPELEGDIIEWLNGKKDSWLQKMYAMMSQLQSGYNDPEVEYTEACFVRLSDGSLSSGNGCYFIDETDQGMNLPVVEKKTYSSGKIVKEQEDAKRFLTWIGVKELDEEAIIKNLLQTKYQIQSKGQTKRDLERFISFIKTKRGDSSLFRDSYVLKVKTKTGNAWLRPRDIFLDLPFKKTGLKAFYSHVEDMYELDDEYYKSIGMSFKKVAEFAEKIGAKTKLTILETHITHENPERYHLWSAGGKRTKNHHNKDYYLPNLTSILKRPTKQLSKLIWDTMSTESRSYHLKASYQNNEKSGPKTANSLLVHCLQDMEWIPQYKSEKKLTFVKPCEAIVEKLPKGFGYDTGREWLRCINFGKEMQQRSLQQQEEEESINTIARKKGIPPELMQYFLNNPKEFEEYLQMKRDQAARNIDNEISDDSYSDRRKEITEERFKNASSKTTVIVKRSVPDPSIENIDKEALFAINSDDRGVICQMCSDPMPFVKKGGEEYYSECVCLFTLPWAKEKEYDLKVVTPLNAVLCPLCSAIYKEYIHKDHKKQSALFEHLKENDDEFAVCENNVRRDKKEVKLFFKPKHRKDIQVCLNSTGTTKPKYK